MEVRVCLPCGFQAWSRVRRCSSRQLRMEEEWTGLEKAEKAYRSSSVAGNGEQGRTEAQLLICVHDEANKGSDVLPLKLSFSGNHPAGGGSLQGVIEEEGMEKEREWTDTVNGKGDEAKEEDDERKKSSRKVKSSASVKKQWENSTKAKRAKKVKRVKR